MDKIQQLIRWCEENNTRKEYLSIKARLNMIKVLSEGLDSLEDIHFLEEIIDAFAEIIEIQQEIIDDLKMDSQGVAKNTPAPIESEEETEKRLNPYLPPNGEFQTDEQVKKAFSNYLQYHIVSSSGEFKKATVYDYVSRVRVLWEAFMDEWDAGNLNHFTQFSSEKILPGKVFLNVYHNAHVLQEYLFFKRSCLEIGENLLPISNVYPKRLNNLKSIANTNAALRRFMQFKGLVELSKK